MYLCLFEDAQVPHLLPLVYTRPVYDLRLGIRTLLETAREAFEGPSLLLHARRYLADVAAQEHDALVNRIPDGLDVLFLNGRYVAEAGPVLERLRQAARPGEPGRLFLQNDDVVAAWVPGATSRLVEADALAPDVFGHLAEERLEGARLVGRLWHLLDELRPALARDFKARTKGYNIYERPGADVQAGALLVRGEQVYLAEGASVRPGAILNAEAGPIYVGEGAVVMEGAVVRGPAFVGRGAQVKIGASVEGSAIGPWSKVGGEVHDAVLHSYANKGHAGFLGHAYLGRWCNLGADTNTSNLKNDYGPVTLYDAAEGDFVRTDRQFLGLFMGDHAKCGINAMFNTGTVVGVSCNLYGAGFPPRHVPSFSWGGPQDGLRTYRLEKALRVAEAVMARRGVAFTAVDREMLTSVFEMTRGGAGRGGEGERGRRGGTGKGGKT